MLSLGGIFDVDRKERRLEEVNREVENPALWDDPKRAQEISKEKKLLDDLVGTFKRLSAGIADAKELFEMALAEDDETGAESIASDVESFARDVEKLEFKRMFNQPMDSSNCYIEIQAGAGGTEAQDWASMLERMYLRSSILPSPDFRAAGAGHDITVGAVHRLIEHSLKLEFFNVARKRLNIAGDAFGSGLDHLRQVPFCKDLFDISNSSARRLKVPTSGPRFSLLISWGALGIAVQSAGFSTSR